VSRKKLSDADDATLLAGYVKLRDIRKARKEEYDKADEADKDRQNKIEAEFLRRFHERGIDSVSAKGAGTAYRSTRATATVKDWEAFLDHVLEHAAWELLEHRANKTAVEQFKDVHQSLPPGVNWSEIQVVNFRRS